jgi:N-carbamoyl-L-amino-acid hydrolase
MSVASFDGSYAALATSFFDHIRWLSHDGPGVTRPSYSDVESSTLAYLDKSAKAEGLETSYDAAGNLWMTVPGGDAERARVMTGSHVDSVPQGGNYDGLAGVIAGLLCGIRMRRDGMVPERTFTTVALRGEESAWFGKPYLGSAALLGRLKEQDLGLKHRDTGYPLMFYMREAGADPQRLVRGESLVDPKSIAAYLELHIEQGATLDTEKLQIGVVEGIVGVYWWDVTITGFANHAGTTAMNRRHDALLSAAAFIEAVNRVVTSVPGRQVGTVGKIQAFPGARNVIPGKVTCTLELRDLDASKVRTLYGRIEEEAKRIGARNGTAIELVEATGHAPAMTDPAIRAAIERSAKSLGLTTTHLPSGAGHDAQSMARLGPMGMIFVPSIGGISHSPKEFSRAEDITNGANVLARSVVAVDAAG